MAKLAARFGNFVQWFKRPHLTLSRRKAATPLEPALDGGVMVETMEMEETAPVRKLTKESAVEKLQRGYEEMVSLMGSVRVHLETQAEKSERLLTILEGLPEALKSLPEATRNQTRTLEAIQTNLNQQVQHNAKLTEALNGLSKSTQRHEHAMSAIGQQLDAGQQRSEQILGSFHTLTGTLGRMTDANEASTGLLRRMAEQESQAAEQVRQLFVRNQKQMTTMSVVSWSLAIVALTVAGYVAVSVSKMGSGPNVVPVSAPSVNTPTKVEIKPTSIHATPTPAPVAAPVEAPVETPAAVSEPAPADKAGTTSQLGGEPAATPEIATAKADDTEPVQPE